MQVSIISSPNNGNYFAFVSFERHRTLSDIASILYSDEFRSEIDASTALILRPPVDTPIYNLTILTGEFKRIIERFPLTPLYILYSNNFEIALSANLNSVTEEVGEINQNKRDFIQFLRQKEMENFIINSSAIIKSPTPKTLFRTPSQEYSHVFLRVGNIQKSRQVLDSIFFWTLPSLKEAGALLTDSWSISSIAFNIARLLARYISTDANKVKEGINNFHVNMLAGFYHGLREMDKETKECLQPLLYNNEKKILFLISAVKTAKSLDNIKKAISKEGLQEKVNYLALYRLIAESEENYLCDLSDNFARENNISFDSKLFPDPDETIIPIDEQSFFPLDVKDDLIEIKKAGADISKDFFETYGGKNVISLHRKSFFFNNTPLRHHGIFVDVSKMLDSEIFIQKLISKIELLTQAPACIIYPPHEQGEKLVNKILEILLTKFQLKPTVYCFADIEIEPENKRFAIYKYLENLTTNDLILIIDDVSITGHRLHTYQRILHNKYFGKIHYLVGVARPESEQNWDRRRRILQVNKNYSLDFVEKVILPNWDSTTCPWCQEKNILKEIIDTENYKNLSVTRKLELRLNELNQAESSGLIDNVFFSIRNIIKPTFIGGSIFCNKSDVSEADLMASIASTIEHLRNGYTNTKDGKFYHLTTQHPLYSIIHPDDYLKGNEKLFEPLIKAGLIRCCLHKELYATEDKNKQEQKKYILNFLRGISLNNSDKSFFIYELYLSMKLGKLPKPAIEENLRYILENYFKDERLLSNP